MPNEPTICAAICVACLRGRPTGRCPTRRRTAPRPPCRRTRSASAPTSSDCGLREALLVVGVREQTERVAALDDRQHLELAVLADEVRDGRVARPRGSRSCASRPRCTRPAASDRSPRSSSPAGRRASPSRRAVAQRPHERLVEEVLDHHRRVAERHRRERVAPLVLVELGDVRLLVEVVVDDLAPARAARAGRSGSSGRTGPGAAARGRGRRRGWSRRSPGCWPAAAAACEAGGASGSKRLSRVDEPARARASPPVGVSNDCSWISSSLTTPEMPSRPVDAAHARRGPRRSRRSPR